jgi:hypothetical protein
MATTTAKTVIRYAHVSTIPSNGVAYVQIVVTTTGGASAIVADGGQLATGLWLRQRSAAGVSKGLYQIHATEALSYSESETTIPLVVGANPTVASDDTWNLCRLASTAGNWDNGVPTAANPGVVPVDSDVQWRASVAKDVSLTVYGTNSFVETAAALGNNGTLVVAAGGVNTFDTLTINWGSLFVAGTNTWLSNSTAYNVGTLIVMAGGTNNMGPAWNYASIIVESGGHNTMTGGTQSSSLIVESGGHNTMTGGNISGSTVVESNGMHTMAGGATANSNLLGFTGAVCAGVAATTTMDAIRSSTHIPLQVGCTLTRYPTGLLGGVFS